MLSNFAKKSIIFLFLGFLFLPNFVFSAVISSTAETSQVFTGNTIGIDVTGDQLGSGVLDYLVFNLAEIDGGGTETVFITHMSVYNDGWNSTLQRCNNGVLVESHSDNGPTTVVDGSSPTNYVLDFPVADEVTINSSYCYYFRIQASNSTDVLMYGTHDDDNSFYNAVWVSETDKFEPYMLLNTEEVPPEYTTTQFLEITPAESSVQATSTPVDITADVWIGTEVSLPIKLEYTVFPTSNFFDLFIGNEYATSTIINSYGEINFSDTIDHNLSQGGYNSSVKLRNACIDVPIVGLQCFGTLTNSYGQLYATSTDWVADQGNALSENVTNFFDSIDSVINITATGTTTPFIDSCAPLSGQFNATKCVAGLFIPDKNQISSLVQNSRDLVLTKAPWGYGTRVYDIFTASSSAEVLPEYSLTLPDNLPVAGTLNLDPWNNIDSAFTMIDETEVDTIDGSPLDEFLFWWNLMWYIVFGLWLLREIMGFFGTFDLEHSKEPKYTKVKQRGNDLYDGKKKIKINYYDTDRDYNNAKRNRL
jgi:hypothetical protein